MSSFFPFSPLRLLRCAFLTTVALFFAAPLIAPTIAALHPDAWGSLFGAAQADFRRAVVDSFLIAAAATSCGLAVGVAAVAAALRRPDRHGRELMRIAAAFHSVPLLAVVLGFDILVGGSARFSLFGLTLIHQLIVLPPILWVLHRNAAAAGGLNSHRFGLFSRDLRPAVGAAGGIAFLLVWNDLGFALTLSAPDRRPAAAFLILDDMASSSSPLQAIRIVILALPAAAIALLAKPPLLRAIAGRSAARCE